jgi:hypothetical protein
MRPLTVITGILLGSCLSIAFSLAAVLFVFQVLKYDYPRLNHEFGALLASLAIFTAMTALCAVSFYTLVKDHRFRWLAQAVMWLGLFVTGYYYWP